MAIDLTQFHDAFFDESFEALDSMESALLKLDTGSPDPEAINTIFRVRSLHQGWRRTFGFGEITSFTHSLETLLDELRGKRITISQKICDLLLKSVDVLRAMLSATKAKQPIDAQAVADLQFDIELIIVHRDAGARGRARQRPCPRSLRPRGPACPPTPDEPRRLVEWLIELRPGPEFFERGTDPSAHLPGARGARQPAGHGAS